MAEHRLTLVCNGDDIVAVHVDANDSNIDGTLRIHNSGRYVEADYKPGEWTHIWFTDVNPIQPDDEAAGHPWDGSEAPDA